MNPDEKVFLEKVSTTYRRASLQDKAMKNLIIRTFEPYLNREGKGLQLGYFEGVDTDMLCQRLRHLDVVEGCQAFIDEGRKKNYRNVILHYSLFEEFSLKEGEEKYDAAFAIYILEHVFDVQSVLSMVRTVLKPDGLLFVIVPNARALSRQLAVHMGIIPGLKELTENDRNHGHRRVYDRVSLNRDIEQSGFSLISQGGIMLKFLADFQMDDLIQQGMLQEAHIDGLYRLGLEYPDLCGSLFAVCRPART